MNKRQHKKQVNHYRRVLAVQEIYLAFTPGRTAKWIFENEIEPRFINISRSTFFQYLTINAKAELKKLGHETSNDVLSGTHATAKS